MGVRDARAYLAAQGVPFDPTGPLAPPIGMRFVEKMRGDWAIGRDRPADGRGARQARRVDPRRPPRDHRSTTSTCSSTTRDACAVAKGYVECPALGGRLRIGDGMFNLLIRSARAARQMRYTLPFTATAAASDTCFVGVKDVARRRRARCLGRHDDAVHHDLSRRLGGRADRRQRRPPPAHRRPRSPDDDLPASCAAAARPPCSRRCSGSAGSSSASCGTPTSGVAELDGRAGPPSNRPAYRNGTGSRCSYGARKKQ